MIFECERCDQPVIVSTYARQRMETPQAERCRKCGAVHSILRGSASIISPVMAPIDAAGRVSPWMLPWTRPVARGWYECRFTDVEPRVLRLWWNGLYFVSMDTWSGKRIRMQTFLSWRGKWQ